MTHPLNKVYDFSAYEHSVMLGDQIRLDAYHQAIKNQVKPGMSVVEVGTGMGILSAYSAGQTQGAVYAIEFKKAFAHLSEKMFKAAGLKHVQVMEGKSFDIKIEPEPEILVTETIGALGPEEHIVEICYDFKKRHPHVKGIIPAKLRIYAEPIHSDYIRRSEQVFLDYFRSASYGNFDYNEIVPDLLHSRCNHFVFDSISDSKTVGARTKLVEYVLGETDTSTFEAQIHVPNDESIDAYHLYFEADLDDQTLLSSHYAKPETHWAHAYVRKPKLERILNVSYVASAPKIEVKWR